MSFKHWYKKLICWKYKPNDSISITAKDLLDTWNKAVGECIKEIEETEKHRHWNVSICGFLKTKLKGICYEHELQDSDKKKHNISTN